jgi:endonuclease-8
VQGDRPGLGVDAGEQVLAPRDRLEDESSGQVRVVLGIPEWQAVGYRLPVVELLATTDEHTVVGHLGPDLLGPDWDLAEAVRRIAATPDRAIAPALLDQRNLAGIGNLYKTEALFLSGVTPWTTVAEVDVEAVVRRAHRLMVANKDHWQQTTTGSMQRGADHWVFERAGRPCRRCGTRIVEAIQAEPGQERVARISYWCPACQAGPTPEPGSGIRGRAAPGRGGRAADRRR